MSAGLIVHKVFRIVAGDPQPIRRGGEAIGTVRLIEVWTADGVVEISLHADEAALLALPDDDTLSRQLRYARDDVAYLKTALRRIVAREGDAVEIAENALGDEE